jgi:hypothetical protein
MNISPAFAKINSASVHIGLREHAYETQDCLTNRIGGQCNARNAG